nr:MAG TPA: hypothetical protein [Caudoviricetes sp.]
MRARAEIGKDRRNQHLFFASGSGQNRTIWGVGFEKAEHV